MPPTTKWSRTRTRTRTRRRSRLYFRMEYHGDDLTSGLDSAKHSVHEVLKYPSTPVPRAGLEAQRLESQAIWGRSLPTQSCPSTLQEGATAWFVLAEGARVSSTPAALPAAVKLPRYLSTECSRMAF
ncbi:hypothetical protein VFPPC_17488 [Pochonia chlamydosporia 170]|uniref:Uncharacterized protein n=1 Tax=Pochonia chlamydosporia 170 TaxID=1380566 RepID=A0A219ARX9_METCM|nr:hypothetical protein VFPPC_17488 [Pochonia chlamydosporia 170]OWT43349.1 hypothetical protein VFPPC_17488 [Pochonia chlamydosporia 170]